jgi:hypothetical protein
LEKLEEVRRLDGELARLASGHGRVRLRMGRQYERLGKASGHHELGFSSMAAYSWERCSQSGRWVEVSRYVARKLESLPVLRAALESGAISWSKAEVLVKVASPENEVALLAEARRSTARALRDALRSKGAGEAEEDGEEPRFMSLSLSLSKEDALLLEATRLFLMRLEKSRADEWVEGLLAEGQSSLLTGVPQGEDLVPEDVAERHAAWLKQQEEAAGLRRAAEVRVEARIARECPHEEGDDAGVEELSSDPHRLDRQLRSDAAELAGRDRWMGMIGARFLALGGWKLLGYRSERQYCRERLGISRSSFRKKMELAVHASRFEELERALLNGTIGSEAALLVCRVMVPETESAWVARAKERTFKHLREEVDLVEFAARVNGDRSPALPPDEDEIKSFEVFASEVLSGRMMRIALGIEREDDVAGPAASRAVSEVVQSSEDSSFDLSTASGPETEVLSLEELAKHEGFVDGLIAAVERAAVQISGGSAGSALLSGVASPPPSPPVLREGRQSVQISGDASDDRCDPPALREGRRMPLGARRAVRMRVREEFGLWFRALEESYERLGGEPERFVAFLCTAVWRSWAPVLGKSDVWEKIYERDGYRCRCPVCFAVETTLHHLVYRSRGGTHAKRNLISLCPFCHLKGEHEARLSVRGTADAPKWILGRRPILVVEGRSKRQPREDERRVS